MAKLIILFFFTMGSAISYLTYNGIGQETIKTIEHEATVRSNSSHISGISSWGSWGGSSSSYNSSSYGYGK